MFDSVYRSWIGIIPAAGGTQTLSRAIGRKSIRDVTDQSMLAVRGFQYGLVNRVVLETNSGNAEEMEKKLHL